MKVIDPGHVYDLDWLDGRAPIWMDIHRDTGHPMNRLIFVKREGEGYPGNVGHHPGTTMQEVLRAMIDRVKYLDNQIPDFRNQMVLASLRQAIRSLEWRAAERHNRDTIIPIKEIELEPTCPKCLHIGCEGLCHP